MNDDGRDSLGEFHSSIFDASDGHQLVDFIRKKKGLRVQVHKIFDDIPSDRQSLHIEIQRLDPDETIQPENSTPAEAPPENEDLGATLRSKTPDAPASPQKAPVKSPAYIESRLKLKRLSHSIGRRTLLKEFERTLQESRFLPETCSTPLSAGIPSKPSANLMITGNEVLSQAISATPANQNIMCTPITVTDEDSPVIEPPGDFVEENIAPTSPNNTKNLMLDLQLQNDLLLEMANENLPDPHVCLNNTSTPKKPGQRCTFTVHRESTAGRIVLSPLRPQEEGVRQPLSPKSPVQNSMIKKRIFATPEQKKLLVSRFARSTSVPVSPQTVQVQQSVQKSSRIPVIIRNAAPTNEVLSNIEEVNFPQQGETAQIIEQLQKSQPASAPVIVIPVNQTFNQLPMEASQTAPKNPLSVNSPGANEITSTTTITTPNPKPIVPPSADKNLSIAVNSLRLQDILTEEESSDAEDNQPLVQLPQKLFKSSNPTSNRIQTRKKDQNKLSLRQSQPRNSNFQVREILKQNQLTQMSSCEILDLRKRNSRGELQKNMHLTDRETSLLEKQIELELLRRSIQERNYEDEVLQMEVLPAPPSEFCDIRRRADSREKGETYRNSDKSCVRRTSSRSREKEEAYGNPYEFGDRRTTTRSREKEENYRNADKSLDRRARTSSREKEGTFRNPYKSVDRRTRASSREKEETFRNPDKSLDRRTRASSREKEETCRNPDKSLDRRTRASSREKEETCRNPDKSLDRRTTASSREKEETCRNPDKSCNRRTSARSRQTEEAYGNPDSSSSDEFIDERNTDKVSLSQEPYQAHSNSTAGRKPRKKKKMPEQVEKYLEASQSVSKLKYLNLSKRKLYSKGNSDANSSDGPSPRKTPLRHSKKSFADMPKKSRQSAGRSLLPLSLPRSPLCFSPVPTRTSRRSPSPASPVRTSKSQENDGVFKIPRGRPKKKATATGQQQSKGQSAKSRRNPPPVDPDEENNSSSTASEIATVRRSKRERKPPTAYWSCSNYEYNPLYDFNDIILPVRRRHYKKQKNLPKHDDDLVANTKANNHNSVSKSQSQSKKKSHEKQQKSTEPKKAKKKAKESKENGESTSLRLDLEYNHNVIADAESLQLAESNPLEGSTSPPRANVAPTTGQDEPQTSMTAEFEKPSTSKSKKKRDQTSKPAPESDSLQSTIPAAAKSSTTTNSISSEIEVSSIQQIRLATIVEDSVPEVNQQVSMNGRKCYSSELMPPPASCVMVKKSKRLAKSKNQSFRTEHDESIADVSSAHVNRLFDQLKSSSMCQPADATPANVSCSGQVTPCSRENHHNDAIKGTVKNFTVRIMRLKSRKPSTEYSEKVCDSGFSSEDMSSAPKKKGDILLDWLKQILINSKSPANPHRGVARFLQADGFHVANPEDLIFQEVDGVEYAFYDTKQQFSIGYIRFNPHTLKKKCTAKKYELNFVVLSGHLKFSVNSNTVESKNGDLITVFVGTSYGIQNISNDPALVMVIKK